MDELQEIKRRMINKINEYDISEGVNLFYINESPAWLDKATRSCLAFSLEMEEKMGRETTTLWLNSNCFTMPIADFKNMLSQLEVYAKDCFNITAQHKSTVMEMDNIGDVSAFDYTSDYPDKLHFTI